ncbi:phage baseplate assembly protein V [Mailhella massiliensis]|uniref:phage baseplate assembly protein V n=1 Tax=Mailhella massiliensis TaxID=1903261 RepID=UPI00097D101A|nr:phage baseplate assembly protein V [Mailhella massiliensis]
MKGYQPDLADLIRVGEVTSVNPAAMTARVTFDDDDGVTSYDLPILQRNTLNNHDHCCVDVGEDALCLFLPTGIEEGFILGSFYAGEVTPPSGSGDVRMVEFSDGTKLFYDRSSHKLTGDVKGDVSLTVSGTVTVKSSTSITLQAPVINLNGAINTAAESGGSGTMTIKGNIDQTGSQKVSGDVVAGGISQISHTHTCPDGETGGPH